MPTTIEGIGTTYYGKKNLNAYQGQCEFCRRVTRLEDYETRLWFVVFYVPVIPLTRKQIIALCTICQRHRAVPLATWHQIKEDAIQRATQSFADNPDDPQSAIELLQTLSCFDWFDEAERLAQGIEQRFDDEAAVQLQIGHWHMFRKRPADAERCYRAALDLDPQQMGAKRELAAGMIATGRSAEAEALMRAAPAIWPREDAALYFELATAYQQKGKHDQALMVLAELLGVNPRLSADKSFCKAVRSSERAMAKVDSILPRVRIYRRPWAWVATAALVVVAALLCGNAYLANHRTLHVVNGFSVPIQVQIDDRPTMTLEPHSRGEMPIAEGKHTAAVGVGGKTLRSDSFELGRGYWARFVDKPTYILNAGCGALLTHELVTYSKNHAPGGTVRIFANDPFIEFQNVDYAFSRFPETIRLVKGQETTFARVDEIQLDPDRVFALSQSQLPWADQMSFAEAHLQVVPDDRALVQAYVRRAAEFRQLDRARTFLMTGLDAAPIRVEWHRMVESLTIDAKQEQSLRERYANMLKKEPNDSAVLYLAGRMERDPDAAQSYFQRSAAADPANPYPWLALGYRMAINGDFSAAKTAFARAAELRPDDDEYTVHLFNVRLALGEYEALEQELRAVLTQSPLRFDVHEKLLSVLAAQGRIAEARSASDEYHRRLSDAGGTEEFWHRALVFEQLRLTYLEGDFDAFLKLSDDPIVAEWAAYVRYQGHLEKELYDAAAADLSQNNGTVNGFDSLPLAIGWRLAGDGIKSAEWWDKAIAQLERGATEHRYVATLLRKAPDISDDELRTLSVDAQHKALILIALAQQTRVRRDSLLTLAEKLNYLPGFPHHFIARAISAIRATD